MRQSILFILCLSSLSSCFLFEGVNPAEPTPPPSASQLSTAEPTEGESINLYGSYFTNEVKLYLEGTALAYTRPNHQTLTFQLDETHNSGYLYALYNGDTLFRQLILIQDNSLKRKYALPRLYDTQFSQDFITADEGFISSSNKVFYLNQGQAEQVYDDVNLVPVQMPQANTAIIHQDWNMLITTDKGKSWIKRRLPDDYVIDELYFHSAEKGLALGHALDEYNAVILSTEDGGESWQPLWENPNDLFFYHETKVHKTRAGTFYIPAPAHNTIVLGDASGKNWEARGFNFPEGTNVESLVYLVSAQEIWLQNPRGLYRTTDGGSSWTEEDPGFMQSGERAKSITFKNESEGIIFTNLGGIYTTTDGGQQWKARYSSAFGEITYLPEEQKVMIQQRYSIYTKPF